MTGAVVGITAVLVVIVGAALQPAPTRQPTEVALPSRPTGVDPVIVLEHAARELRSGLSLTAAVTSALAAHPMQLAPVRRSIERGDPLSAALAVHHAWPADEAIVVQALAVALRTDGAAADTLDRAVMVARERRAWRHERHAQAAQARLSAWLLTLLPLAFAGWGVLSSERVRGAYVTSPLTATLTAIGLLLNLTGWWWMRHLVRGRFG